MVTLNNDAELEARKAGRDYYRWRVFVDAPESLLSDIEEVTYVLHPTFPEPEQTVRDAANRFAFEASGWGEFAILAHVKFRDGHTEEVTHWLKLDTKRGRA